MRCLYTSPSVVVRVLHRLRQLGKADDDVLKQVVPRIISLLVLGLPFRLEGVRLVGLDLQLEECNRFVYSTLMILFNKSSGYK